MKYDDLSFTVKGLNGEDVICDIVSIVPNNNDSNQPFVVYTDYMLDENKEFILQYGKIIEIDGEYVLRKVTDEESIDKIKEGLKDDIVNYVNKQIEQNISE